MSKTTPLLRSASILQGVFLLLVVAGTAAYGLQYSQGLSATGLSRDAPWGLYIAQFTFLVGIAASSVVVLLPSAVHRSEACSRLLVLGELVAIIALLEAMTFVLIDLGQPQRVFNVLLHPSPTSLMFWDLLTLGGYLGLCLIVLGRSLLFPEAPDHGWHHVLAWLAVPWAFAIHIVTALLYAGLAARPAWMTALLAPRFLATAFASGPALLLLLLHLPRLRPTLVVGPSAIRLLANVMTYAIAASLLFAGLEVFTALYSGVPDAGEHVRYLLHGLEGHWGLTPWSYAAWTASLVALALLLQPRRSERPGLLLAASALTFTGVLIEKGCCWIPSGFVPSPLGEVRDYHPSLVELLIVVGVHAGGALLFMVAAPRLLRLHTASRPDAVRTTEPLPILRTTPHPN